MAVDDVRSSTPEFAPAPDPTRERAVSYGARPLLALGLVLAIEQGERQSLSVALPGIKEAFAVSDTLLGALPLAMAGVGLLAVVPFGILADRVRRTWLIAGAMLLWTVCMGLNGLALTFGLLVLARVGLGAVEANSPAALSLIADYYPVEERARRLSLYQLGALGGSLVAFAGGAAAVAIGGWRWAFFMWVPLGLLAAFVMARTPEPRRGDQDADFGSDLLARDQTPDLGGVAPGLRLPVPTRTSDCDYGSLTGRQVVREVARIRSMWCGVAGLTASQLMLNGLAFWGITYFVRVHDLSQGVAPLFAALLGIGAAAGIIGGGFLSDAILRRGHLNARVWVSGGGSIAAAAVLMPAFASTNLLLSAVLLCIGGALLTLPVGPSEAFVSDVVVAPLRGRAATVRSVVRTLSSVGPLLIGLLADATGLRLALVVFTPVLAIGGLVVLLATRTYAADLAFMVAETQRLCGPAPTTESATRGQR